ncbi:hypothetical protein SEPCBS119000_002095 [Sporothrix epigloea]|uniref:Zn(2)-C6 fungal-type domain-containing protein n=1 Tax=Sporothrix epigloea TaxID=1892477 RepID=A0ABP0DE99_9PEZI
MEPLPGGVPTVAGRTPIACINCANAKTGCDKRVPCSRCAEKNLSCAARFARRSSKAAVRAAQANATAAAAAAAALNAQLLPLSAQSGMLLAPTFMDPEQQQRRAAMEVVECGGNTTETPLRSPLGLEPMLLGGVTELEMCLSDTSAGFEPPYLVQNHLHEPDQQAQQHYNVQHLYPTHAFGQIATPPHRTHSYMRPDKHHSPYGAPSVNTFEDLVGYDNRNVFLEPESSYQDYFWANYPLEIDAYAGTSQMGWPGQSIASPIANLVHPLTASPESSDISSSSEPANSLSWHGSIHTRETSILSSNDSAEVRTYEMGFPGGTGSQTLFELGAGNITIGRGLSDQQQPQQHRPPLETAARAPCRSGGVPEFEVVVASEAAWPLARCTPLIFSGSCPRTAIVHLECLEQKSKQEGTWAALDHFLDSYQADAAEVPQVIRLTSQSRDKLLAITQSFLHKALKIHRGGIAKHQNTGGASSPGVADFHFSFVVLPPSRVLEYFLKSYVHSLAVYYPLIVRGVVDANEMLENNQVSTLLVLLMIAQGAATVPMAEARYLSAGLLETCRISLFDQIEKNVELSADLTTLRCALLFTLLGAWSGDKWHMDIAMGQRCMYLSMLKHAGMLEPQTCAVDAALPRNNELSWRSWLHREAKNRLVYNWVMVDQELSLFHDTAPFLSISDLRCPLPSPEALWLAPTADVWATLTESTCSGNHTDNNGAGLSSTAPALSLYELFQEFLHDNLASRRSTLSQQQLRLLLHPLQSLLCHLQQMLSCLADDSPTAQASKRTVAKASTLQRLEEIQALLRQWHELTMALYETSPDTLCNLVLYHLISLNAFTNFPEIERLARREGIPSGDHAMAGSHFFDATASHTRCILLRKEALFHCGQALRLLNQMPFDHRPNWWSAALYRVVLILWADCTCLAHSRVDQHQPTAQSTAPTGIGTALENSDSLIMAARVAQSLSCSSENDCRPTTSGEDCDQTSNTASLVAIDRITPKELSVADHLLSDDGVGALLSQSDGSQFMFDKPSDILAYGVKRIDEAASTRISDGIRRKLVSLARYWGSDVDQ